MLSDGHGGAVEGDHISPDLVYVRAVCKVDHVRGNAAAWAHVYLQRHKVAFFPKAFLIFQKTEKLKVDKTALYTEAFYGGTAYGAGVIGKLFQDVKNRIIRFVYDIHDGHGSNVSRLKHGLTVGIDDGIVGIYFAVDKLFHNVSGVGPFYFKELL